jgi:hypothetical protein
LLKKVTPIQQGETWVGGGQTGDEMVFPSADGSFGGVSTVACCGCKLEIDVLHGEKLFENLAGFVVEALEDWFGACIGETLMEFIIRA